MKAKERKPNKKRAAVSKHAGIVISVHEQIVQKQATCARQRGICPMTLPVLYTKYCPKTYMHTETRYRWPHRRANSLMRRLGGINMVRESTQTGPTKTLPISMDGTGRMLKQKFSIDEAVLQPPYIVPVSDSKKPILLALEALCASVVPVRFGNGE